MDFDVIFKMEYFNYGFIFVNRNIVDKHFLFVKYILVKFKDFIMLRVLPLSIQEKER